MKTVPVAENDSEVQTKKVTVAELAESLGVDYIHAVGFVKVLEKAGALKEAGKKSATGGRGKPSTVFEIPCAIDLVIFDDDEATSEVTKVETAEKTETEVKPTETVPAAV